MNATHKRMILGCLFSSTLVFASCWGRDPNLPELVPVSGTVTLGGRPLPDALVRFIPVGETRGSVGSGRTDAQGKYELYNNRAEPGTAVGNYRVTIEMVPGARSPGGGSPGGGSLPDSDGANIPSATRRPRQVLPPVYSSNTQTPLKANVPDGGKVIDFPL